MPRCTLVTKMSYEPAGETPDSGGQPVTKTGAVPLILNNVIQTPSPRGLKQDRITGITHPPPVPGNVTWTASLIDKWASA